MRRSLSPRPTSTMRRRSSVPSPRRWNRSLTSRANSASSDQWSLVSRPTPTIWRPYPVAPGRPGPGGGGGAWGVVGEEGGGGEPLVRDALVERDGVQVAHVDAPLGE